MKRISKFWAKKPTKSTPERKTTIKTDVKDVSCDENMFETILKFEPEKAKYEDLFLYRPAISNRRHTSILLNELNYKNISQILKMTDRLSMASFINNLLAYHFEEFGDEIEESLQKFMEKSTKIQRS